jgi:hypothetical protein
MNRALLFFLPIAETFPSLAESTVPAVVIEVAILCKEAVRKSDKKALPDCQQSVGHQNAV